MTYSPIIPNGVESPAAQVSAVQTNFAQFASIFSSTIGGIVYNHTALNNTNQGDHESVIFTNQSSDPVVNQALTVLYGKNATSNVGTQPQLFIRIPQFLGNQIPNTPMQLTYNSVNTAGPIYQSFLAGGYILYFGSVSSIAAPITLSPVGTTLLVALAQANNLTSVGTPIPFNVSTNIISSSQFKINSTNATGAFTFTWMAIATV